MPKYFIEVIREHGRRHRLENHRAEADNGWTAVFNLGHELMSATPDTFRVVSVTEERPNILCSQCGQSKPGPGVIIRWLPEAGRVCRDCDRELTAPDAPREE